MQLYTALAQELSILEWQAKAAVELIDAGNTIPFIARYRKEATGALDDTVLRKLDERLSYLRNLDARKQEICAAIKAQDKLTPELEHAILCTATLAEAEDLYRPYKQKRRTRACMARELGLEPLAELIWEQLPASDLKAEAACFCDANNEIESVEQALQGAMDIIAERICDDAQIRKVLRSFLWKNARIVSSTGSEENEIYQMYHDFEEPICKVTSHRVLALDRGERERALRVSIEMEDERCIDILTRRFVKNNGPAGQLVQAACIDGYHRLLFPSLERELRSLLTEQACHQAISVFSDNLTHLLMQPPIRGMVTMGFDPAYRTGCKIAVVDETGKVLDTTVVYPTPPQNKTEAAKKTLTQLIRRYNIQLIAIGNGTASRESEAFVAQLLREIEQPISYVMVSEAGASVYSASELGSQEFPQYDVSLRSAISIARRLQDPLSELVKIDPKAIGVGQYQHDMPAKELSTALEGVVEDCVNRVGVDLNTASHSLLSYIAGINSSTAKNIVAYREEHGPFKKRSLLLKVPRLGKKAYEQAAGFLRILQGENVLDNTGVHPESYHHAQQLLTLCGYTLDDVKENGIGELRTHCEDLGGLDAVANRLDVGVPTLSDIIDELLKPGRDPRDQLPKPILRTDVLEMKDLKVGMELTGTVRNVIDFGAFVDIGVHEDGLVHISQLCDRFIRHPSQLVKVGDLVNVKVLEVDLRRKRISLTMKGVPQNNL